MKIYILTSTNRVTTVNIKKKNLKNYQEIYYGYVYRKSEFNGAYFQRSKWDERPALSKYRRSHHKSKLYVKKTTPVIPVRLFFGFAWGKTSVSSPEPVMDKEYYLSASVKNREFNLDGDQMIVDPKYDEWQNEILSYIHMNITSLYRFTHRIGWRIWYLPGFGRDKIEIGKPVSKNKKGMKLRDLIIRILRDMEEIWNSRGEE